MLHLVLHTVTVDFQDGRVRHIPVRAIEWIKYHRASATAPQARLAGGLAGKSALRT
jgi:hypothetical protein